LNETCKDALNISEFVDSIKVQLTDLETVGQDGYVEGVSKILIKNLNELDTCKRPIHCSDVKREVLYIKDNDKWSKEGNERQVIKKAIKDVSNKNIRQITEWANLNPDCRHSDSRKNDQYLKIVMNSMSGGSNEEQTTNIEKIITNITKSVIIEK
jgi:signal recognition particle subunit SEC65